MHTDAAAPWDPSIYNQTISDNGYQYLTTRDGTKLAIDVHPPTDPAGEPGLPPGTPLPNGPTDYLPPYPTLIEYSGYGYADPAGPESGIAILANLMGFAVVDVNMRGTGCSGGAFNFFEPLQNLDGYDVIETIAHQPWVLDHKVGMMGISYGAISQLFVSQLDPPALEAISPLSTIDATASTLYPGGILNTGFAVAWAEQRQAERRAGRAQQRTGLGLPADPRRRHDVCSQPGPPWRSDQPACPRSTPTRYYNPAVANPLDPDTFVNKIKVPVFMACQWEDEQTGGHCPELVSHFTGTTKKWFTFTNGAHIDSLDPATFDRWYDFLELFVAHQAPIVDSAVIRAAAPVIYQDAMGLPDTDPITLAPRSRSRRSRPTVPLSPPSRSCPRSGCSSTTAPAPLPPAPRAPATPIPGSNRTSRPSRSRNDRPDLVPRPKRNAGRPATGEEGINWYTSNASALPLTDFGTSTETGGLWGNASQWQWNWEQNPSGSAVSYVSAPLTTNTTVIGGGAVYVWVSSSTPDVDLQATVSEVRPDGNETFVQNGWIRASERKLSTGSDNEFDTPSTVARPDPELHEGRRCAHAGRQVRRRSPSRCTTRDTSTVRDHASV